MVTAIGLSKVQFREFFPEKTTLTSTASEKIKKATNTKNSPFTNPAITSALPYLEIREMLIEFIIHCTGTDCTCMPKEEFPPIRRVDVIFLVDNVE